MRNTDWKIIKEINYPSIQKYEHFTYTMRISIQQYAM